MAEPTNPLFEDEKEFLERQKLEYERALMGEVEEIKVKTQQISKYVAIGAGVLSGVWLISKVFSGPKKYKKYKPKHERELSSGPRTQRSARALRKGAPGADLAVNDDLGFGSRGHHADRGHQAPASERAHIAPDVYHTETADLDSDPFRPLEFDSPRSIPAVHSRPHYYEEDDHSEGASSIVADTFRSFLQSDTGKMLVAQATAVLMAVVAKKMGEYLPMFKNPDLADTPTREPETRDIDFTFHDDDANAPHQPL
ncbi:hypothetical protein MTX78_00185 [Hymenobacter tibetensis]|uniref:Uncharacterized protein n=1 Tax=Hymenobacter tibetensis TaxID=497967 RepID=A0ABY4CXP1_9BACT|nr:hypothetical protein [Hymenobacter tibetensis]UOG75036.1 hypothetical protein MTX78_00185 [Hymenobacter tibetensis]